MRLGLGLSLAGGGGGTGITTLTFTGLTSGYAAEGDNASISVGFPSGVTAWTSEAWGIGSYGDTTLGTGANPTTYDAYLGSTLYWEGEGDDGNTYQASATIAGVPDAMSAPTVTASGSDALDVDRASAPNDNGAPITQYDLRYDTDSGMGTATTVTDIAAADEAITGLTTATQYYVQTRAVNALGNGDWSTNGTATTGTSPPTLSGTAISQQDELRGVAMTSLDASTLFSGTVTTYSIDEVAGDPLPAGMSINSGTGAITGTPTEATNPSDLPVVYVKAANAGGSVTDDDGITFTVTGPVLSIDTVTSSDVAISTDDTTGTVYWAFCNIPNPTDAALIAGSGTGILIAGSFAASAGGDDVDLTAEVGTNGYMVFLQVGTGGAYSNVPFTALTPVAVAPTLVSTSPADDATDIAVDSVIDLVFDQAVSLGTGNIVLRDNDGGFADLETFNAATGAGDNSGTLTIVTTTKTNDTVRITPGANLANNIEHAVRVASTAVLEDATDTENYAGITDDTTVSFTTVAGAGGSTPTLLTSLETGTAGSQFETSAFTPSSGHVLVVKVGIMNGASASAAAVVTSADIGTASRTFGTGTAASGSVTVHNSRNNAWIYRFNNPGTSSITFQFDVGSSRGTVIEVWEYPGDTASQAGATDTDSGSTGTSAALSIAGPEADATIAYLATMRYEAETITWTGADAQGTNRISSAGSNTNDLTFRSAYEAVASADPAAATASWTSGVNYAAVAMEIEAPLA